MNVSKLSLVLLAISSNLPILGWCCGNKNNGKNKESKSTPGGGSKPKPNPGTSSFTPDSIVNYNSKTLDDIKLPPKFTQEEIGNYEYKILADFGITKELALKNAKNIRYYKTKGIDNYDVFIFFYNIFNKSSKYNNLFDITEHIYYINYSVDEYGDYYYYADKETPEYFF